MSGNRVQRALLVEIMVAVLFFGLCATVLLQTFAAARSCSQRARVEGEALVAAQDLAERLIAAEDASSLLEAEGFSPSGGVWAKDGETCALEVCMTSREMPAGELLDLRVRALRGGEAILELPCARYIPKEAAP